MSLHRTLGGLAIWLTLCLEAFPRETIGELVQLTTLTRHGSRAPNTVIDVLCPNNKDNRASYHVPPGQLTENGMKQALKLGEFLRSCYVDTLGFLPPTLGSSGVAGYSSKFTSDSATRCLMTAQAMAQGLFPSGTGPPGFPNQPVAVETNQAPLDNLLAAPHGACLPLQKADNKVFDETRGAEIISQNKETIDIIAEACGTPLESYDVLTNPDEGEVEGLVLGVKDVSDMINFDQQQGLTSLPAITDKVSKDMTAAAFQLLQERYYSTPEQVTYWAGGLPQKLVADFEAAAKQHAAGQSRHTLYEGYHGHRELLYGLAHLLGWHFDVPGMPRALGTSAIPPGTTMFFELHRRTGDEEEREEKNMKKSSAAPGDKEGPEQKEVEENDHYQDYYVRTYTWTPEQGQQEAVLDACKDVEAGNGCPLSSIKEIVEGRIQDIGTWQSICQFVPFDQAEEMAQKVVFDKTGDDEDNIAIESKTVASILINAVTAVGLVALGWLGVLIIRKKWLAASRAAGGEAYQPVP